LSMKSKAPLKPPVGITDSGWKQPVLTVLHQECT
jgi:hypothetical protein